MFEMVFNLIQLLFDTLIFHFISLLKKKSSVFPCSESVTHL